MRTPQTLAPARGAAIGGALLLVIFASWSPMSAAVRGDDDHTATASPPAPQKNDAWNLFRRNSALNGTLPGGALADALAPLWMFDAGDSIESTAAIVDGRVYFGSLDTFLYALDLETGEELWRFQAAAEVKSSPSVFDGVVYFGDEFGEFHALDAVPVAKPLP